MTLTEVLDTIDQRIDGGSMSMGEMLNLFRYKGYGPLLLVPTVIVVLPTGAIPGVPTACGLIIALVALQIVLGKPSPWIPRRLREVSISRSAFDKAYRRVRPVTLWIDRFLKPRLTFLLRPPVPRLMAALCTLLALTMIPLELLPFAAAMPAVTIALLAMGLAGNDGLWLLLGIAVFAGGAAGLSVYAPWV